MKFTNYIPTVCISTFWISIQFWLEIRQGRPERRRSDPVRPSRPIVRESKKRARSRVQNIFNHFKCLVSDKSFYKPCPDRFLLDQLKSRRFLTKQSQRRNYFGNKKSNKSSKRLTRPWSQLKNFNFLVEKTQSMLLEIWLTELLKKFTWSYRMSTHSIDARLFSWIWAMPRGKISICVWSLRHFRYG